MTQDSKPDDMGIFTTDLVEFPVTNSPRIFVDGVSTLVVGAGLVKYHFYAQDPDFYGKGQTKITPYLQMIMSVEGFAAMCVFFDLQIKGMLKNGTLTQERYDAIRQAYAQADPGRLSGDAFPKV